MKVPPIRLVPSDAERGAARESATAPLARPSAANEGAAPAVVPVPDEVGAAARVGQVLRALGRLSDPQIDTVLARQSGDARRFGEIALSLGFVTQADIQFALERQRETPLGEVVLDLQPGAGPARIDLDEMSSEALIAVRSQLVHRWFGDSIEQRALAIVSPRRGDGRSYVCAHLGRLFAELDDETLLIDANLRQPRLHQLFEVDNAVGLSTYLARGMTEPPVVAVPAIPYLHLMPAGPPVAQPHALIARRAFASMLEWLAQRFKVILIDTPAAELGGDALRIALLASGALLVVRKNRTRLADVRELGEKLTAATVDVLGAVINEIA